MRSVESSILTLAREMSRLWFEYLRSIGPSLIIERSRQFSASCGTFTSTLTLSMSLRFPAAFTVALTRPESALSGSNGSFSNGSLVRSVSFAWISTSVAYGC